MWKRDGARWVKGDGSEKPSVDAEPVAQNKEQVGPPSTLEASGVEPDEKFQEQMEENKENNDMDHQDMPTTLEPRTGKYYVWIGTVRFQDAMTGKKIEVRVEQKSKGATKHTGHHPTMSSEDHAARFDENLGHWNSDAKKDSEQIFSVTVYVDDHVMATNNFDMRKYAEVLTFWLELYPQDPTLDEQGVVSTLNPAMIEHAHHSANPWDGDVNQIPHHPDEKLAKLEPGHALYHNQAIFSDDHQFRLIMQGDGNVVLCKLDGSGHYSEFLWATWTMGAHVLYMQRDGNLVVYTVEGWPLWWTGTHRVPNPVPPYYLQLQNDSNLVIYQTVDNNNYPQWSRWW